MQEPRAVTTDPQQPQGPYTGGPQQYPQYQYGQPAQLGGYQSPAYGYEAVPPGYGPPVPPYGPVPPGYVYPPPHLEQSTPGSGLGVAGFVTGLLGLLLFWIPGFGLLLGIVGIVLSAVGMSQIRRARGNAGLAVAGLVCGALGAVLFLVVLLSVSAGPSF
jgi:Domain of unknown function (DUF4190)